MDRVEVCSRTLLRGAHLCHLQFHVCAASLNVKRCCCSIGQYIRHQQRHYSTILTLLAEALALEEDPRESESKLALTRTVDDIPTSGRQGATPQTQVFLQRQRQPPFLHPWLTALAPRLPKEAELCSKDPNYEIMNPVLMNDLQSSKGSAIGDMPQDAIQSLKGGYAKP